MKLIEWIKPAFEGIDGKASHKKLSVFATVILYFLTVLVGLIVSLIKTEYPPSYILFSAETIALAFSGIHVYNNLKQEKLKKKNADD